MLSIEPKCGDHHQLTHLHTYLVDQHEPLEVAALPLLAPPAHGVEALLLALGVEVRGVLQEGPPQRLARCVWVVWSSSFGVLEKGKEGG